MAEAAAQIAYPEWTEYRKKNGLDLLGMQTGSIGLYQTLLPGISNVPLTARSYAAQDCGTSATLWRPMIRLFSTYSKR